MNLQLIICNNPSIKEAAEARKSYERSAISTSDPTTLAGVAKNLNLYPMGLPWIPAETKRQTLLEFNSDLPKLVKMCLTYFKDNFMPVRLEDVQDAASVISTPLFSPAVNHADLDLMIHQDISKIVAELTKPSDLDGVYQPNWEFLDGKLGKASKVEDVYKRFQAIFEKTIDFLRQYIATQPHNDATRTKARNLLKDLTNLVAPTEIAFGQLIAAHKVVKAPSISNPLVPSPRYYFLDLDANV
jgi:hypothetical protein